MQPLDLLSFICKRINIACHTLKCAGIQHLGPFRQVLLPFPAKMASVREATVEDIPQILTYWYVLASDELLFKMGVDKAKMPQRADLGAIISTQIALPYQEKQSFWLIWLLDGQAIGHSNAGKVVFGQEAYMHLHSWFPDNRAKGHGRELVFRSLWIYFNRLQLQRVFCEPNAHNAAPNHTLQHVGFQFIKQHTCVPGWINYEQEVKTWEMTRERFEELCSQRGDQELSAAQLE